MSLKKSPAKCPSHNDPRNGGILLSILGGVAAAVIWFLYGGLREGFDSISAILMIAMPVAAGSVPVKY